METIKVKKLLLKIQRQNPRESLSVGSHVLRCQMELSQPSTEVAFHKSHWKNGPIIRKSYLRDRKYSLSN